MEVKKRRGLGALPKQEQKQETRGTGRIANGLTTSLAARRQLNIFDVLDEENQISLTQSDERFYIDRRGRSISLTNDEQLLVKALSARIPFGDNEIINYINELQGETPKDESGKYIKRSISVPFSIMELSRTIIGDTKEASIKKIGERLLRLSEARQAVPFFLNGKKYLLARPLIKLDGEVYEYYSNIRSAKGKRKPTTGTTEEEKILIGLNIEFTPIFLHEANNKYCPIYPNKLFEIARKNKTEIFLNILSDLESKWRQYYINSQKKVNEAAKANKELKATNRTEYNKVIEAARIDGLKYTSNTLTIRDGLKTDYESTRKRRADFIPDLERAINSLVEYGIITDKSYITKDKTNVIFYYNPDFANNDNGNILPLNESYGLLK